MISDTYAVLKFVTTGLSPGRGDRAIEIGIVLISNSEEINSFSSLINPSRLIDPGIVESTGISNEMLGSAPSAQEVASKALKFIGDSQLVAHNASLEHRFWRHEFQPLLDKHDKRVFVCNLMLSRRIFQSFSSHSQAELARELKVDTNNTHRALNDARVTAQVFSVLLGRLRVVYSGETIDRQFLLWYQQKSLSSLPDLTTINQTLKAGNISAPMGEQTKKKKVNASERVSDQESRASTIDADAKQALEALEALEVLDQLTNPTLSVDDHPYWKDSEESEIFRSSLPRRPYIVYGEEDMPSDIEYLAMSKPKPEQPVEPARPDQSDFKPDITPIDKLIFREQQLRRNGEQAYSIALQNWQSDIERLQTKFKQESSQWIEEAKALDEENTKRYQQCVEDQKLWWEEKQRFNKRCRELKASADNFKQAYSQKEQSAVERYVYEILSRITYPDYFPDEMVVSYAATAQTVEVSLRLILPDDLPRVASVSYDKAQDEISSESLSAAVHSALYSNVVRSVCIRTVDEIIESDSADAVVHVIVSGYVKTVDLSTGHDQEGVIASVLASKQQFLDLRLTCLNAPSCFEGLGGRGTLQSLPKLNRVVPFTISDVSHSLDATV